MSNKPSATQRAQGTNSARRRNAARPRQLRTNTHASCSKLGPPAPPQPGLWLPLPPTHPWSQSPWAGRRHMLGCTCRCGVRVPTLVGCVSFSSRSAPRTTKCVQPLRRRHGKIKCSWASGVQGRTGWGLPNKRQDATSQLYYFIL